MWFPATPTAITKGAGSQIVGTPTHMTTSAHRITNCPPINFDFQHLVSTGVGLLRIQTKHRWTPIIQLISRNTCVSAVRSETALAAPIAGGIITETLETIPNTTLRSAVVLALGLDLAPTGILLFGIQEKPTVLLLATIRRNATLLKD